MRTSPTSKQAARAGKHPRPAALRREERAEDPQGHRASLKQSSGRFPLGDVLAAGARHRGAPRRAARRRARPRSPARSGAAGRPIGDVDFLVVAERRRAGDGHSWPHAGGRARVRQRRRPRSIGASSRPAWTPTCGSCRRESFGAALHYFTGSKDHNVALRRIAIEKRLKLNEYGVFRGEQSIAGRTEEEVYAALGLPYIPPELREDPARSRPRAPARCRR